MAEMKVFDRTFGLLERVLDLRQQNQKVIASNLANVETPGYTPVRLDFEGDLRRALGAGSQKSVTSHPGHFPIAGQGGMKDVQARVLQTPDPQAIGDRNGVSKDQEMVAMAENQILYEAAVQMLNKKMGMLKYVAGDGR